MGAGAADYDRVEGGPARRQWLWREAGDVVTIANYESVVRDRADVCDPANRFDLVVLDESQRIKNRASTTNEVVRSISRGRSWALTGTPIENSVDDLVGIFEFVSPGLRRREDEAARDRPGGVRLRAAPHEGPGAHRPAAQAVPRRRSRAHARAGGSLRLAEDEGVVRLREMKNEVTIQHVFELVLRLKQICNFDPATGASSKLERLEADLEECAASGRKAIVFSQWVQTLVELRSAWPASVRPNTTARFLIADATPSSSSSATIRQCHVMLMTYGAGSVGLNLQFASYVFLFDRWWNPAVEDQAINRAHRIGADGRSRSRASWPSTRSSSGSTRSSNESASCSTRYSASRSPPRERPVARGSLFAVQSGSATGPGRDAA